MLKYRITKCDYKKVAKQTYWETFKRLIFVVSILFVIEIYSLIVGLIEDSKYLIGAYVTLAIFGVLAVVLIGNYLKTLSTYKQYGEAAYQITYDKETMNIVNELTGNSCTLKTVDLRLIKMYKSYLLFIVPADVERLLIVPRNAETKDFEEFFALKSTV